VGARVLEEQFLPDKHVVRPCRLPVSASAAEETTFFDGLAWDVDSAVEAIGVVPTKVVVCSCSTACFRLDEVSGVRCDFQYHVAGVESSRTTWVGMQVVHDHLFWDCMSVVGQLALMISR
jgi:hypothetical protein